MFHHIIQWQQIGLVQKAYCLQNNIAYSVFHYWYRQYRNVQAKTDSVRDRAEKQSDFVPLQVQSYSATVELLLTDGRRLVFHQMVSSDYLKSLIS
jgi:hypothetical protein